MLSDTSDTNYFEEGESSDGKARVSQKNVFTWSGSEYRVVDIENTSLIEEKALYEIIAETINLMPEGINQVLFVVGGRFTKEEIVTLKLFKGVIFESGIAKYITIVRTKFDNFKNEGKRKKDEKVLRKEIKSIKKIVDSCRGIVYLDNPPMNIRASDDDDQERIKDSIERRKSSRNILLKHLDTCQEKYSKLKELGDKIADHIKKIEFDDKARKKKTTKKAERYLNLKSIMSLLVSKISLCQARQKVSKGNCNNL